MAARGRSREKADRRAWAEGGPPHGLFCGLLRRAQRVCAFCVLPFRETAISGPLYLESKDSSLRSE